HQWRDTTIGSHGGCRQDGVLRGRARLSISARAEPGTRHRLGGLLRLGVPRRVHNLGTAKSAIPDMARALRALAGYTHTATGPVTAAAPTGTGAASGTTLRNSGPQRSPDSRITRAFAAPVV